MSPGSDPLSPVTYSFADYRLTPARRSLTRADGTALTIAGKPFDVLLCLVRHAGEVVDRNALMSTVWPKRVVEENNVNQIIASLRRTLGPQHIVTVAGRGYQLVTPVRALEPDETEAMPRAQLGLSPSSERTPSATRTRLRYAVGAALVLAVAAFAATRYGAKAPRIELLAAEPVQTEPVPTELRDAQAFYMASFDTVDREEQLRRLDRALELDPRFVDAWIRKAGTHGTMAGRKTGAESAADMAAAIAAARKAVELDPSSAAAHSALAAQLGQVGAWIEAELEWRQAVSLPGGETLGPGALRQLAVGHVAGAAATMEERLLTNALDQGTRSFLLIAYEILGRKDDRRRHWEYGEGMWGSEPWMGDFTEPGLRLAEKDLAFLQAHQPRHAAPIWTAGVAHFDSPAEGLEALRSFYADPAMRSVDNLRVMTIWALHFGDPALALEWFREAVKLQATSMMNVWLPQFEPMRREPGFKELIREQGLPEYWRLYGWPQPALCRATEGEDFECV